MVGLNLSFLSYALSQIQTRSKFRDHHFNNYQKKMMITASIMIQFSAAIMDIVIGALLAKEEIAAPASFAIIAG